MQALIIIILIGVMGGVAIGIQSPLASMISQRLGVLESVFLVHLGGALVALVPLLIFGSKFNQWRSLPWYAFGAGAFGLVVIFAMSYMIPRVGVAPALIILLAGQLLMGSVMDHFGWLGAVQRPFELTRLLGLSVVLAGVWLTVK
ncbi:MAG: DMT family transporter [Anaerolineales bacterium]|nr:MAG: DMT family transporter [Anaerolineales bacterium]